MSGVLALGGETEVDDPVKKSAKRELGLECDLAAEHTLSMHWVLSPAP